MILSRAEGQSSTPAPDLLKEADPMGSFGLVL